MAFLTARISHARTGLLLLVFCAFVSLGFPAGLLGVAWPSMRAGFGLPLDALGLLLMTQTAGYLISTFFNGRLVSRFGIGTLLLYSCLASAAALLGYVIAPAWGVVVGLGVAAGLGAGAMDAGINTYMASEHSAGHMQWLHAAFGVGATLGPVVMTAGLAQFDSWRPGYIFLGVFKLALAGVFFLTLPAWKQPVSAAADAAASLGLMDYRTPLRATLARPLTWLSMAMFLLYAGTELTLGNWTYTVLLEGRGLSPALAGLWAGGFWATFTLGRVLAGLYTRRVRLERVLRAAILLALGGAALFLWNPAPAASLGGVFLIGFALAPIFPALVSSTSARVGPRHAANAIGIQISASGFGGALVPALAGLLAQRASLEIIPALLCAALSGLLVLYTLSLRVQARQLG